MALLYAILLFAIFSSLSKKRRAKVIETCMPFVIAVIVLFIGLNCAIYIASYAHTAPQEKGFCLTGINGTIGPPGMAGQNGTFVF